MKIKFHYTYLIVSLGFILSGYFPNLLIFTSIIIIHEIGHYLIAKKNNFSVDNITIYPYGGLTKINMPLNTLTIKELQVAIAGVLFQEIYFLIIYYLYRIGVIREYIFNIFNEYNKNIFFFNLLPIYPLDGSKIFLSLLNKIFPYKYSSKIIIIFSVITIIVSLKYYKFNYTLILIITIIIDNLIKYYKELKYLFNKFLLERYLSPQKHSKTKIINNINKIYKEKNNVIKENRKYFTEKQFLKRYFTSKFK